MTISKNLFFTGALTAVITILTFNAGTGTAHAQQGGGRRGGPGGGPGGFGGPMMGRQQRDLTVASVPLDLLTTALSLTDEQQTKVKTILDDLDQKRQDAMEAMRPGGPGGPDGGGPGGPPPGGGFPDGGGQGGPPHGGFGGQGGGFGGPGGGGPGGGPGGFGGGDPAEMQQRMQEMQAQMQKLQTEETRSSRQIEQLLTADQKTALTASMREWKIVQQMGLPLEVASQLKLTEEQKTILEKQFSSRNSRQGGNRQGGGQGFGRRGN